MRGRCTTGRSTSSAYAAVTGRASVRKRPCPTGGAVSSPTAAAASPSPAPATTVATEKRGSGCTAAYGGVSSPDATAAPSAAALTSPT